MATLPFTCKDCGSRLDAFGICPNADQKTIQVTWSAPIHCGRPELRKPSFASAGWTHMREAIISYGVLWRMQRPAGMNERILEDYRHHREQAVKSGWPESDIDRQCAAIRERVFGKAVA